ncbi:hypothetical protein BU24DRAFT_424252 [Aaosphaeria arxii CBS 175.79]|uniref:Uncharacterized protein n=1 Tax=Aaosphaeria arxii CBS 175.79 TaxID=1450172 RepID=A0A6A5XJ05_9PLEO|nr:uncharacterized protein BU24DRAFT_424252 [Aaosphaeria arxii CBS 175.79]KAF2013248.1 hypothetical protein BU24DRAFT_424252 [Aaosphaeria arxii CBS 175.79]
MLLPTQYSYVLRTFSPHRPPSHFNYWFAAEKENTQLATVAVTITVFVPTSSIDRVSGLFYYSSPSFASDAPEWETGR